MDGEKLDDFISSDDFFLNDFIPNAAHILFRNVLGTKYLDEILFEREQIAEWMDDFIPFFFLDGFIPNTSQILLRNVLGTKCLDEILFKRGSRSLNGWMTLSLSFFLDGFILRRSRPLSGWRKNWMTSSLAMTFS